jgi:hypothetical protein
MKKHFIRLLIFSVILFAISSAASAQVYVKVRPTAPVVVRTARPSSAHIWIGEEWEPNGSSYRYKGGYWATPPHPGYYWRAGYWRRHNHDGEGWVPGAWRRK